MNKKYGAKSEMLLTDTDKCMHKIEIEDVFKDLTKNKELIAIFQNIMKIRIT